MGGLPAGAAEGVDGATGALEGGGVGMGRFRAASAAGGGGGFGALAPGCWALLGGWTGPAMGGLAAGAAEGVDGTTGALEGGGVGMGRFRAASAAGGSGDFGALGPGCWALLGAWTGPAMGGLPAGAAEGVDGATGALEGGGVGMGRFRAASAAGGGLGAVAVLLASPEAAGSNKVNAQPTPTRNIRMSLLGLYFGSFFA
jgi:hypothetical protein